MATTQRSTVVPLILTLLFLIIAVTCSNSNKKREIITVKNRPDSVVWVVQLSDLHFSVNHPNRAVDFNNLVGPTLSFINPSLVLITGDLTDGKSRDLLTMKLDEREWVEYRNVMEDVIQKSGLDKSIFYDLRGNHDNYGIPSAGGSSDFFSIYSLNAQAGRKGNVNSVTLQTGDRRHLFVGIDTAMAVSPRGPTNLLGHPTDKLLAELDSELSQWDAEPSKPVTKVAFGHFPLSFSATSESGRTLKDIFLKHSISTYLCGHLHMSFGKNLKRHHQVANSFIQLNMHQSLSKNFSNGSRTNQEFWEWEMGDWWKNRAMRIIAIDNGHTSFVDIELKSGAKKTIILPTFPLDSRLMWTSSLLSEYEHQSLNPFDYTMIRALVFSSSPIVSVTARVYDSKPGILVTVLETMMTKLENGFSRGDLYTAHWNFKAFADPSPERYWLQVEAIDIKGRSTLTELRPFSINGVQGHLSWTWKEFKVMGCQWAALYIPIFWFLLGCFIFILLVPMVLFKFSKKMYTFHNFSANKGFVNGVGWVLAELYKLKLIWVGFLGYLLYLVLFPWFSGQIFSAGDSRGLMTYKGWGVKQPETGRKVEYIGFPDVMVVVIPHLVFVVFPSLLVAMGFSMENDLYRIHVLYLLRKKEDDYSGKGPNPQQNASWMTKFCKLQGGWRWVRKFLMVICLAILSKHFKNCRSLMKAYDMNPLLHFPVYCLSIPTLLAYAVYKTSGSKLEGDVT